MKIVIAGGSGQVGQVLARRFEETGHDLVILTRRSSSGIVGRLVCWNGRDLGDWVGELDGADVVINLAGRPVNCRYSVRNRAEIIGSRLDATRVMGQAIARVRRPPRLWLQAATATIYPHGYDVANGESSPIAQEDEDVPGTWRFSVGVAKAWERTFDEAPSNPSTRRVLLRISLVLSPDDGGVFDVLLGLVRRGLGGQVGDGRQYISWIHDSDFVRAILRLIKDEEFSGVVNLASPSPLPNAEFMRILREAWGTKIGLPAPRLILEIAAFFMRTESELVLKSRRVVPSRLLEAGFQFTFPDWAEAAQDLCRRWRKIRKA